MRVWFIVKRPLRVRGIGSVKGRNGENHEFKFSTWVLTGDEVTAEVSKAALQEIRQKAEILGIEPSSLARAG